MDLDVEGSLPHDLSGRYLCVGPAGRTGSVHAIAVHDGRATSYSERPIELSGTDESGADLIEFAGRILSLADGSPAYEIATNLDTIGRVDLAGGLRGVGAHPKVDPASAELHLISLPGTAAPRLHVIPPGGLTRRTRSLDDAPAGVRDLALTPQHVVLIGDRFIGITARDEGDAWSWHDAGPTTSVSVIAAHDDGETVALYVVSPALERWTVRRDRRVVDRCIVDPAPQSCGRIDERRTGLAHRFLYTVERSSGSVLKHDLLAGTRTSHQFGSGHRPGEFLFVTDPRRSSSEDGGWLLGLVDDADSARTCLVVLDATDLRRAAVAVVRLPRPLPRGLHGLWSPNPL